MKPPKIISIRRAYELMDVVFPPQTTTTVTLSTESLDETAPEVQPGDFLGAIRDGALPVWMEEESA